MDLREWPYTGTNLVLVILIKCMRLLFPVIGLYLVLRYSTDEQEIGHNCQHFATAQSTKKSIYNYGNHYIQNLAFWLIKTRYWNKMLGKIFKMGLKLKVKHAKITLVKFFFFFYNVYILQYIILKNEILRFNSFNITSKRGYISQYTPQGVYGLIGNEINEEIISFIIVKMIYCPYQDSTLDIRSNIPLRLEELPWASPQRTPSGEGVYLTIYPSSHQIQSLKGRG